MTRTLLVTLALLFLFTGLNAQAQRTRATVAIAPQAAQVLPTRADAVPPTPRNQAMPINLSVPATKVDRSGGPASASLTIDARSDLVTYIHTDAVGSPVARTDNAGNLVNRSRCLPTVGTPAASSRRSASRGM